MAIVDTKWNQFRAAGSSIPPDIFFRVLQSRDEENNIEKEVDVDKSDLIGAHKLLLAGSSEVFRANFFGLLKMTGEVMVVKETTEEAFATLVNFIYCPGGKEAFSLKHTTSLAELCDIIEISERYQVQDLVQIAKDAILAFEITRKNVIASATIAKKYNVFEGIEEMLNNKNLDFLEKTMKSANDVFALMAETDLDNPENEMLVLQSLAKMMQGRVGLVREGRKI